MMVTRNNRWYNRLLLSYFPIFIVAISTIIFISFFIVSEITKKEAERANLISTKYLVDSLDSSLRGVEQMILKELATNPDVNDFFQPKTDVDQRLVEYQVSNDLKRLTTNHFLIHSIYFYRFSDKVVLTQASVQPLEEFRDRGFILSNPVTDTWSPIRKYREFELDPEEKVITLTKKAMLPFGDQGLVVINVRINELFRMAGELVNSDLTFLEIWRGNELIYPGDLPNDPGQLHSSKQQVLSELTSDYLGWRFVSGLKAGQLFRWVSVVSYVWLVIGVLILILSIASIIYITKRNYKPIEIILGRIQEYQQKSLQQGKPFDEFSFIEKALDNLIDQTNQYEKRFKEDLLVHRKQFFNELIDGEARDISKDQWVSKMKHLNLGYDFAVLYMGIVEIDNYRSYTQIYSERDQQLLKFALTNVMNEIAKHESLSVWPEWISSQRLGVMFLFKQENDQSIELLTRMNEQFCEWVRTNLKFSVTISIGTYAERLTDVRASYLQAESLLNRKMILGGDRVAVYSEEDRKRPESTYEYYQKISTAVQYFRMTNEAWADILGDIFNHMKEDFLEDERIRSLTDYLILSFKRELEEMPDSLNQTWLQEVYPLLAKSMEETERLDRLADAVIDHLSDLYRHYLQIRESKGQMAMLGEMRKYIEEHFALPDLSLTHLSEKFDVNAKYLSQLFKEQFGMKFVDFLVELRMEKAKQLLLETDDSIQDVAEKVGYTHGISFGRTFKKIVGTTPGDYRKLM